MKKIAIYIIIIAMIAALFVMCVQRIDHLTKECDRYKQNSESLMSDVEQYRVRDSLNAARVQGMELTLKEYERFRADDAALINSLKARNKDLAAVNKTQSETIIDLQAMARDTVVIIRDSISVPAVALHCGDEWFDFDGVLADGQFTGTLNNRDSLILAETVKYKRFLGFLWKTRRIQERQLDVVSKNPHTNITDVEHITIERK